MYRTGLALGSVLPAGATQQAWGMPPKSRAASGVPLSGPLFAKPAPSLRSEGAAPGDSARIEPPAPPDPKPDLAALRRTCAPVRRTHRCLFLIAVSAFVPAPALTGD
jgi:hypothetical protein